MNAAFNVLNKRAETFYNHLDDIQEKMDKLLEEK